MQTAVYSEYNTGAIQDVSLGAIYSNSYLESERRVHKNTRLEKVCEGLLLAVLASTPLEMHALGTETSLDSFPKAVKTIVKKPVLVQIEFNNVQTKLAVYPNFSYSGEYQKQIKKDVIAHRAMLREQALRKNFMRNMPSDFPEEYKGAMYRYSKMLSYLDFKDNIVQYNTEDEVFEYSLYFDKGIKLALSVYADETENLSDFCIFQDHELLVADTLPIRSLISKMEKIITKIEDHA